MPFQCASLASLRGANHGNSVTGRDDLTKILAAAAAAVLDVSCLSVCDSGRAARNQYLCYTAAAGCSSVR